MLVDFGPDDTHALRVILSFFTHVMGIAIGWLLASTLDAASTRYAERACFVSSLCLYWLRYAHERAYSRVLTIFHTPLRDVFLPRRHGQSC